MTTEKPRRINARSGGKRSTQNGEQDSDAAGVNGDGNGSD